MLQSPLEHPVAFAGMFFVLFVFYFDLAWFREQFCAFLCPYARFQSVMMDANTPVVAYDEARGEPRGRGKSKGDCIDCELCVRVCPTGIDIRKGLQLECISCARCIDACNGIMKNLGRKMELIRTASLSGSKDKIRPKALGYFIVMLLCVSWIAYRTATKEEIEIKVVRAPGTAFTRLPTGEIANIVQIRLDNNSSTNKQVQIMVDDQQSVKLLCGQCNIEMTPFEEKVLTATLAFPPAKQGSNVDFFVNNNKSSAAMTLLGPNH
jgi:cytochrome c oxidase accessory protein FixG